MLGIEVAFTEKTEFQRQEINLELNGYQKLTFKSFLFSRKYTLLLLVIVNREKTHFEGEKIPTVSVIQEFSLHIRHII